MHSTPALDEKIKSKLDQLISKFKLKPIDVLVALEVEHNSHYMECKIQLSNGTVYIAIEHSPDMYETIERVCNKLTAQIHKAKDKEHSINHHSLKNFNDVAEAL